MKVDAFTIMELLMVMALTGLAIAISWGIYAQFYLFGREYELRNQQASELSLLHRALELDTQRASSATATPDSLHLQGPRPVSYLRISEGLVRVEASARDTFHVPIQAFSLTRGLRSTEALITTGPEGLGQSIRYSIFQPPTAIQP